MTWLVFFFGFYIGAAFITLLGFRTPGGQEIASHHSALTIAAVVFFWPYALYSAIKHGNFD